MRLAIDNVSIVESRDYDYFAYVCESNTYQQYTRKEWFNILTELDALYFECRVNNQRRGITFLTNRNIDGEIIVTLDGYRDERIKSSYKDTIKSGKLLTRYAFNELALRELWTENRMDAPEVNILAKVIGFKNVLTDIQNGVYMNCMVFDDTLINERKTYGVYYG